MSLHKHTAPVSKQGCSSEANCGGRLEKLCMELPRTLRSWAQGLCLVHGIQEAYHRSPAELTAWWRLSLPVSTQDPYISNKQGRAGQGRFPCIPVYLI